MQEDFWKIYKMKYIYCSICYNRDIYAIGNKRNAAFKVYKISGLTDETPETTEQTKNNISPFLFAMMVLRNKNGGRHKCKQLKQWSLSSSTKI